MMAYMPKAPGTKAPGADFVNADASA